MKKKTFLILLGAIYIFCITCKKGDTGPTALLQGAGGSTAMMTLVGNYLYIVNNSSLQTYDVSQPENIVLLNQQNLGWNIETIFPYRDKLFIGSQTGMFVFDNSNPKSPKLQGQAQHIRACDPIVADDNYAYVTLRNNNVGCGGTANELNIYDIQGINVLTPKLTSTLSMMEPQGLGYKGNILYVCQGASGLGIVDITDKVHPSIIKNITGEEVYKDVIPYGNLLIAYIEGGIMLYDITNAKDPKKLSTIKTT